jgi:hypothetical protein
MDKAKAKKALRIFWMIYAVLMIVLPPVGLAASQFGVSVLIISVLGAGVLWAVVKSPIQKTAARVLQAFFLIVIAECTGALIQGDLLSPLITLPILLVSVTSLVVWREQVVTGETSD